MAILRNLRTFRARSAGGWPYVLLVVVVGFSMTLLAAFWLNSNEVETVRREFARRSVIRHQFLLESFRAYERVLFSLRLVVLNNQRITPEEFANACAALQDNEPGIKALQWAPVISGDRMDDFLTYARERIAPDFTIRERTANGTIRPPSLESLKHRTESAVITYCHPQTGNDVVFGYDIFTAPTSEDLLRARRNEKLTLTRPFLSAQGFDAVILCWFAHRAGANDLPPETGDGFVQLVIELRPMLDRLWHISPASNLDFALFDITDRDPLPLYARVNNEGRLAPRITPADFITPYTQTETFEIGGRLWRAHYRPTDEWIADQNGPVVLIVLIGGGVMTLLIAAFLYQTWRKTAAIREEVELRTCELRDQQKLFEDVLNHSPTSIWVKDSEHRYILVNAVFCAGYRKTADEMIGATDFALYPPDIVAKLHAVDAQVLGTGHAIYFEDSYDMQGDERIYFVVKFPIRRSDGATYAVGGIATDITELRRAESDRQMIERRLLETQRLESLGVLAGGIAHDFNNLLTGILGHASLLQFTVGPGSTAQASLTHIEQAARRAADLCRQMLAYAGRGRVVVKPVRLDALVREVVPLLKPSASRGARMQFRFEPGLPAVVADESQLNQIVMNLVMNAAEALGENGGDITISTRLVQADASIFVHCVHHPELRPGPYVLLEVSDTGCGMDEATRAKIFDPFFTTKFAGRGLGLAAVLGIVRSHHGALHVSSRAGQGTTFGIYLPAAPADTVVPDAAATDTPALPRAPVADSRILLADDEVAVREIATPILRLMGHSVDTAPDGEQALKMLRAAPNRYVAALVDLTMPGISGLALLEEIRRVQPDLPVLFISGFTEQDAAALLAHPRTAFLSKPFNLDALRAKLDELLRG